jgi:hypothetical protein
MARERWFYAQGSQRRGPLSFDQFLEGMLGQPDPRAILVWRKGFADWTRAEDVPEVERRLTPLLAEKAAEEGAPRAPRATPVEPRPPRARVEEAKPGSPALVYGGIAAGIVVMGLLAWLFWPRPEPHAPPVAVPLGGTTTENAPAVVIPATPRPSLAPVATPPPVATPATTRPAAPTPAPAGMADRESELPRADVRQLRGVAAWSGETLKLTVYNGTAWRVTELYVRVGRFQNDDFVEDPRPLLLVPPAGQVDAGVADLLSRVAPDRKKPGLNPADTGPFEAKAGQQPENFRWEIESARGYAPQ